ncbi:hypothetical protein H920_10636 [Fukomys damarensis]|uniref:Uncharacterized protein n=1 Tax=Fukomys damarensis TaxID=885580 RepID=A0A091DCF3_FUKDA|nr:hypothetical protein H920_10636 [Fukomys damarensis]
MTMRGKYPESALDIQAAMTVQLQMIVRTTPRTATESDKNYDKSEVFTESQSVLEELCLIPSAGVENGTDVTLTTTECRNSAGCEVLPYHGTEECPTRKCTNGFERISSRSGWKETTEGWERRPRGNNKGILLKVRQAQDSEQTLVDCTKDTRRVHTRRYAYCYWQQK